jgi:multiple antibiotic resistance protein
MHDAVAELIRGSLLIIGALFPLVNGSDNIPIFLTLTVGLSTESRAVLARKIAVYGFALLLLSIPVGTHILNASGGLVSIRAGILSLDDAANRWTRVDFHCDRGGRQPGGRKRGPLTLPVAALLGRAILAVTIYLVYGFAEPIGRILGKTAMNVLIRLSSFILVCIGVQIVWNGASALLRTIFVPLG